MSTGAVPKGMVLPAEPMTLLDAVQYASGAVVSRTLSKSEAGTLTLFAFDEGQGLSEHTAPFDALVQVLDGAVTLTIGGTPVPAQSGQLVLMPAGVPHAVQPGGRFKMLLTMFKAAAR